MDLLPLQYYTLFVYYFRSLLAVRHYFQYLYTSGAYIFCFAVIVHGYLTLN
jgi:hypothetical protein